MTLHSISGLIFTLYLQQGWFETHVTLERVIYWASLVALGVTSYYGLRGKKAEAIAKTDSMTITSQQTLINTRDKELMDSTGKNLALDKQVTELTEKLRVATESGASIKTEYMALASLDVSALLNFAGLKKELELTQMREAEALRENMELRKTQTALDRRLRAVDPEYQGIEGSKHVSL
jgi:hypothetical protein